MAVDYDTKKGNYTLIDPIRESFGKNPEESVFMGFSGYVLVPKYPSARKWNLIAGTSLILCGLTCGTMIFMRHKRSCQPTTDLAKEP